MQPIIRVEVNRVKALASFNKDVVVLVQYHDWEYEASNNTAISSEEFGRDLSESKARFFIKQEDMAI
jgi:hypothetical protein